MAFVVVFAFLRLYTPREGLLQKLKRVDWMYVRFQIQMLGSP